jgi:hypothetical protein
MTKGLKTFKVQKRFTLWVETSIKTADMEAAFQQGKKMTIGDFITIPEQTEVMDVTELSGFQIGEEWF